ncbi:hypothetical protein LCGC14_1413200 [marine sediment metagenome]|uniref:Uncharacterized protein n=1 Tax=marine sediment metagenome TaxID=412755 RepID=A0A0F9MVB5_9ZZZZ
MTDKIFACVECGQVYYDTYPEQCMYYSILNGECASTDFKKIKKEDIINIHDLPEFLFNRFIKKLF